MGVTNKLHMLNMIPNPPPSHPTRGGFQQQASASFIDANEKSYSHHVDNLIEKSHLHSTERSFEKVPSGLN